MLPTELDYYSMKKAKEQKYFSEEWLHDEQLKNWLSPKLFYVIIMFFGLREK